MIGLEKNRPTASTDALETGIAAGVSPEKPRFYDTIAYRLVGVVLLIGALGYSLISYFADIKLQEQLAQQTAALGRLSEEQLANRLDGEAQLAKSRIEQMGAQISSNLRMLARRPDIVKAVVSGNNVLIRETLRGVAEAEPFTRLLVFDAKGSLVGANSNVNLLTLNANIQTSRLMPSLQSLLYENDRLRSKGYSAMGRIPVSLLDAMNLELRPTFGFVAAEAIYGDFGDVIGAIAAYRTLGKTEPLLDHFSSLANVGVVVLQGEHIFSGSSGANARFVLEDTVPAGLIPSLDKRFVGRCTDFERTHLCTFTESAHLDASRSQLVDISMAHGTEQKRQYLTFVGIVLGLMLLGLAVSLRHIVRGLAPLSSAAHDISQGNLNIPFKASGVGEIRRLGEAFEKMLVHLRSSTAQIRNLAYYDGVTHLPNREKMLLDAPEAIRAHPKGAVLFMDLDGFKAVNDSFGHKVGDLLLQKVSERLTGLFEHNALMANHLISRLGGDEFAVVLPGAESIDVSAEVADQIIRTLRPPFTINGTTLAIGVSIGIAPYPASGTTYEQLLTHADLAMYAAKTAGRNSFAFFTPKLAEEAQSRRVLKMDLEQAIRNETLSVYFQPKVLCSTGQIRGVEALARWFHPECGPISPGIFIPVAEESGMIRDLGRVILKKSLTEIGALLNDGADIVLSVNVTAVDIEDPKFARDVTRLLAETRFPPGRLELEVTESIASTNATVVRERMNVLRQLGIRFSMDDFGAGYSNLGTVARLPFDAIKIDRSLVHGVAEDPERQTILRVALGLASELGFDTVVEGVELPADMQFVAENGATYVQGYIFSPPVSIDKFAAMLQPGNMAEMLPDYFRDKLPASQKAS